jgi:eukaryotic-like serine/threonine-protein kinase
MVERGRRDERGFTSAGSKTGAERHPLRVLEGGISLTGRGSSSPLTPSRAPAFGSLDGPSRTIGRYALHAEIAAGGMAAIHIGRLLGPVGFARTVAIKRLHAPLAKDPEFVAMFLDEARLAARIRHPNVVSTLDIVATEGELFVVMEYVQGESLARLMRTARSQKEPIPQAIVATTMVGVLHGLHAAHEARDEQGEPLRIVHRDVSPHNVLVGIDGAAHVIDFGIAKARGRMQITRDGQIKGKLSYMPPEQLLGQGLDHRADVFAASIVFWEALTGRRLFEGIDDGDIYARVLHGELERPSTFVPELGAAVDSIVMRGLARDRNDRYPTAREMALAIEAVMPLAPPSRVGAWVENLAGESIAERMEQIADIEGGTSAGDPGDLTASSVLDAGGLGEAPVRLLPTRDRTAPTQPDGLPPASPTRVDVGAKRSRPPPALTADDSLAAVAGVPGRGSRRVLYVVLGCSLIALGAAAAIRSRALNHSPTALPGPVTASTLSARPAEPAPPAPANSISEPPTISVQSLPTASDSASVLPVSQLPRASRPASVAPAAQRGRPSAPVPVAPAPVAAPNDPAPQPEPAPTTTTPSCDPPYWYDASGNKRYYRHCVGR